jgi:hypothetical protein
VERWAKLIVETLTRMEGNGELEWHDDVWGEAHDARCQIARWHAYTFVRMPHQQRGAITRRTQWPPEPFDRRRVPGALLARCEGLGDVVIALGDVRFPMEVDGEPTWSEAARQLIEALRPTKAWHEAWRFVHMHRSVL